MPGEEFPGTDAEEQMTKNGRILMVEKNAFLIDVHRTEMIFREKNRR